MVDKRITSFLVFMFACQFVTEWSAIGQTTGGSNAPNHALWPLFAELMAAQYGRTVQDINALGTSDPFINTMWKSYEAAMPSLDNTAQTPTTTTQAPPLPDLYQPSYSFSSSSAAQQQLQEQQQQQQQQQQQSNSLNPILSQIMTMINSSPTFSSQTPTSTTSGTNGGTSLQDIMAAYQNLNPGTLGSSPTSATTGSGSSAQDLMAIYMQLAGTGQTGTSGGAQSSQTSTSTNTGAGMSLQDMMAMYNQLSGSQASSTSGTADNNVYQSLLSQLMSPTQTTANAQTSPYNQLQQYQTMLSQMSSAGGASTSSSSTPSYQELLQQYQQLMSSAQTTGSNNQVSGSTSSPSSAATSTATGTTSTATDFEQQMAELFPQFKDLLTPTSSSSSSTASQSSPAPPVDSNSTAIILNGTVPATTSSQGSSSSSASNQNSGSGATMSNAIQDIFDLLLFGKPSGGQGQSTGQTGQSGQTTTMGGGNLISSHMENTFKARASRDMGCRFLPELLELEILPTMPIQCLNKCPFPYVNAQKFGVYCVCCPPGVNHSMVQIMSLLKRRKYLTDNPLAVIS